jgi:hypothetical protein
MMRDNVNDDRVIAYMSSTYSYFTQVPLSYLDLENRKVPAVCGITGYKSLTVVNIWRDVYVSGWFSSLDQCHVMRTMPSENKVYMLQTRRRCKERPGVSANVIPLCCSSDVFGTKSKFIYVVIEITSRPPYVISFDTLAAKIHWRDWQCACEPLLNQICSALFSWMHYNRECYFCEDVIREWSSMDAFRMCNGRILKRVSEEEFAEILTKEVQKHDG